LQIVCAGQSLATLHVRAQRSTPKHSLFASNASLQMLVELHGAAH
jgi:hypothetical protein